MDNFRSDLVAISSDTVAGAYRNVANGTIEAFTLNPFTQEVTSSIVVHTYADTVSHNTEVIKSKSGFYITFGDGDYHYIAEVSETGNVIHNPTKIGSGDIYLTASDINDDLVAVAISKNDTKEIFLKVLSKDDFSVVVEEQKVADGALATDSKCNYA